MARKPLLERLRDAAAFNRPPVVETDALPEITFSELGELSMLLTEAADAVERNERREQALRNLLFPQKVRDGETAKGVSKRGAMLGDTALGGGQESLQKTTPRTGNLTAPGTSRAQGER